VLALVAAPSAAASRLAYAGLQLGIGTNMHQTLYAVDGDGRHRVALTHGHWTHVSRPTWSPDGKHIVFSGCRDRSSKCLAERTSAFYLVNADGGGLLRLFAVSPGQFEWSADSKKLLVIRDSDSFPYRGSLYVIDAATGKATRPTWQSVESAHWSPRSERIAYLTSRGSTVGDIWISDAAGHNRVHIRPHGWNTSIAWSPDARWIAFVNTAANDEVAVTSPDDVHLRQLTNNVSADRSPVWIGASTIAYTRAHGKQKNLMTVDVRTGKSRLIARDVDRSTWSPNGQRLALTTDAPSDISIGNADGTGMRRITSDGYSGDPQWSPDGGSLFYLSGVSQDAEALWIADADGRHARRLAEIWNYDVAWRP
jgi:Tol biopolymer transport system component